MQAGAVGGEVAERTAGVEEEAHRAPEHRARAGEELTQLKIHLLYLMQAGAVGSEVAERTAGVEEEAHRAPEHRVRAG
jgi:hypothetical protein